MAPGANMTGTPLERLGLSASFTQEELTAAYRERKEVLNGLLNFAGSDVQTKRVAEKSLEELEEAFIALKPPPSATGRISAECAFKAGFQTYLDRLLCEQKRSYAKDYALYRMGVKRRPVRPKKDWVPGVETKVQSLQLGGRSARRTR